MNKSYPKLISGLLTLSFILAFNGCYWRNTRIIPDRSAVIPPKIVRLAVFLFKDARTNEYDINKFQVPALELQEKIIARLSSNPKYAIVEREEIEKVLREQKLQMTGAVEYETAVKTGRILGVQAILIGSFTNYGRHWFRMPYVKTGVTFRVVEIESGQVICSKEIIANNVNFFYPFRNLSASLNQAADAIAEVLNQASQ